MGWMADETGLGKTPANHVPLTPLSHLNRAARVFPGREAWVYGARRMTYADYHDRVTRLASALARRGIEPGDVVATLLPNIPAQSEAAFGVPAAGAVLNTINIRLDVATVSYILDHGGAKAVLVDPQFVPLLAAAIDEMEGEAPLVIEVADDAAGVHASGHCVEYEALLAEGDPAFPWIMPEDEWESLALNYTSGTTGRPKGVVYHHRRRLSEHAGHGDELADGALSALSADRAAVSLQWLVSHMDDARPGRHRHLLPRHHRRRDLCRDRR